MNRRSAVTALGVLAFAVALVVLVRFRRNAADAAAALASARRNAEGLAATHARLEKQTADDRRAAADLKARVPATPRTMTFRSPGLDKIENDAALQGRLLAAKRARLGIVYGPFYRALKLTPDQIKALEAAIMDREASSLDLDFAAEKAGSAVMVNPAAADPVVAHLMPLRGDGSDSPDLVAAHQLADEIAQKFQANATGILGQVGQQQLQTYEQTLPQRNYVNDFNGTVASSGHPLSAQQIDDLTQALAAANQTPPGMPMVDPLENDDYAGLLGKAKTMLSSEQYTIFQQAVAEPQSRTAFRLGVRKAAGWDQ